MLKVYQVRLNETSRIIDLCTDKFKEGGKGDTVRTLVDKTCIHGSSSAKTRYASITSSNGMRAFVSTRYQRTMSLVSLFSFGVFIIANYGYRE